MNLLELHPTNWTSINNIISSSSSSSSSSGRRRSRRGRRRKNVGEGGRILVMLTITKVVDVATKLVSFFISGNQRYQADRFVRRVYKSKL